MAKANRSFEAGWVYHLTHRCHDRAFLLRFARDRDTYRSMLRGRLQRYGVPLLGYSITSNHVHLVVEALRPDRISPFMDALEGDFAQHYNLRKGRTGAFWGGRYHATAIQPGTHLWNCLIYVELNMVRAGVVDHPSAWAWCSYPELAGGRRRYRLVSRPRFAALLGQDPASESFRANYRAAVERALGSPEGSTRQSCWTSLAVGGADFLSEAEARLENRVRISRVPAYEGYPEGTMALEEEAASYG